MNYTIVMNLALDMANIRTNLGVCTHTGHVVYMHVLNPFLKSLSSFVPHCN